MAIRKGIGKTLIKGAVALATVNVAVCAVISHKKKKEENSEHLNEKKQCKHFEIFMQGRQINLGDESFNKVKIKTVAGGVNLDLRSAVITEDIIIKCKSVISGINIRVPEGVNVVIQGKSFLGGVTNFVPTLEGDDIPTVYIEAIQVMGSLCVKNGLPDEVEAEVSESEENCNDADEIQSEDGQDEVAQEENIQEEAIQEEAAQEETIQDDATQSEVV